jgi:Alpha/beta hydrolase domain
MRIEYPSAFGGKLPSAVAAAAALLAWAQPSQAKVTKIVIDGKTSPAFCDPSVPVCTPDKAPSFGNAGQYEIIRGRAFGELDRKNPLDGIIQDIELAKDADGKVRYTATFQIVKPVNMSLSSHLMWHDVPNRGGRLVINTIERGNGDVGLSSGWQGDNSGSPTGLGTLQTGTTNEWVQVPVARNADGSAVTGTIFGRIVNQSGTNSQQIFVQANRLPYKPFTLDTTKATLTSRVHETMTGKVTVGRTIPSDQWAWAKCDATHPFPGTALGANDPAEICLKPTPGTDEANGFNPNLLYQVVFTARDPYVLGVGFAAWRDVGFFFKTAAKDDFGNENPLANANKSGTDVKWSIARGVSQSGNFLRGWLHLGFNQAENGKQVHDGLWPIIAGRRIALNFRWAQPDGVLELYQAGSEGPQWWKKYQDEVRGLPRRGILDRCKETRTCPKVIEHFGAAEVWELKLPIEWVGTDAKKDIPIPENVRRYYIPSSTHGGGGGGFDQSPPATLARCPGNNYGQGILRPNPVPHTETVNAIRAHFRDWVMTGKKPPPSLYPTLRPHPADDDGNDDSDGDDRDDGRGDDGRGFLVEPTLKAMGFPRGIPGVPAGAPEFALLTTEKGVPRATPVEERPFINPVLDYNWGPEFNPSDGSGVPTNTPPPIRQVIKMLVPRVDADGNELGGVPVVLRDAPLASYFGWNITAAGFHKDQNCNYVGGMVPFAKTKAEREATKDPRASLEERYKDHAGYVAAVTKAAAKAVARGFLLQADADALITQANASNVLK